MKSARSVKYLIAAVAITLLACAFAGCGPEPRLVVGTHLWVGYEPIYLAREMKWLPDTVELREDKTLAESLTALRSGRSAATCMTLDEMLRARAAGLPLSAALVFDVSAGADAVLVRPEIKQPADLAGKRIGFDPDAVGALVFEKLLDAARLPSSAVVSLNIPPDRQLEAWRANRVDAVITYEPMVTPLLHAGARSLLDSREMPDTIIDVLAVRRDRPEVLPLVRQLVANHFRALDHMRTNQEDALLRIAAREGLSPDDTRRMLAGVVLPSLAANRGYIAEADARLVKAARTLSQLMVRRGLLAREDSLEALTLPGALPPEEK